MEKETHYYFKKNRGKVTVGASTSVVLIALWEVVLKGAVHTWCLGTSAWVPAQNDVVFTI